MKHALSILLLACASMACALRSEATVLPGGMAAGYFNGSGIASDYQITFRVHDDPGQAPYFWANQFAIDTAVDHGGYFGMQAFGTLGNGQTGRILIFSIWNATAAEAAPDAVATPFGGEGVGWSVRRLYPWKEDVPYTFRLSKEGGLWWRVVVSAPGVADIDLGRIQVTVDAPLRSGMAVFTEYYLEVPGCKDVPYARASFENARYGGTAAIAASQPPTYGNCAPNARATTDGTRITHRTGIARSWSDVARSDFNDDGKSDLLWRNHASGVDVAWLSANHATQLGMAAVTDPAWEIVGTGDFNGDGAYDVLWRNRTSGANAIWKSGNRLTQQSIATVGDRNWKVAGVEDFDSDGLADILWRNGATGANTIWKSGNPDTRQAVSGVGDPNWRIAGTGDFNGDGRADIAWRHGLNGRNSLWLGGDSALAQNLVAVTSLAWKIVGVGDFDGDGEADLLWRNAVTGGNTYWRSGKHADQVAMPAITDLGWVAAAVGDYDGDGKADIVWRHAANGSNAVWYSANRALARNLTGVTNLDWKIVPPATP